MGAALNLRREVSPNSRALSTRILDFWLPEDVKAVTELGKSILTAKEDWRKQHNAEQQLLEKIKVDARATQEKRQREVDEVLGERPPGAAPEIPVVESRGDVLSAALSRMKANMAESIENEKNLVGKLRAHIFDSTERAVKKVYAKYEAAAEEVRAVYLLLCGADIFTRMGGLDAVLSMASFGQLVIPTQPTLASGMREYTRFNSVEMVVHGRSESGSVGQRLAEECQREVEALLPPELKLEHGWLGRK